MKKITLITLALGLMFGTMSAAAGDSIVNVTFNDDYKTAEGWTTWQNITGFSDANFGYIAPTGETAVPFYWSNVGMWMSNAQYPEDAWLTYTATNLTIGDSYEITAEITTRTDGWGGTSYRVHAWDTTSTPGANTVAGDCEVCAAAKEEASFTLTETFEATDSIMVFGLGAGKDGATWYERTIISSFSVMGVEGTPVAIEASAAPELTVTPNPASSTVVVSSDAIIYSLTGAIVKAVEAGTNDISDLAAGIYVVKTATESVKLIVE